MSEYARINADGTCTYDWEQIEDLAAQWAPFNTDQAVNFSKLLIETRQEANYARTASWLAACGKHPSMENTSLQIGCHIEEVCEFLRTLRTDSDGYAKLIERTCDDLEWFASKLKRGDQMVHIPLHLRADALDALCDAEVTGNGVAYMAAMDKPRADRAVLDSNDAKLVDGKPVILPGGKIGKPEGWQAPDLTKFV